MDVHRVRQTWILGGGGIDVGLLGMSLPETTLLPSPNSYAAFLACANVVIGAKFSRMGGTDDWAFGVGQRLLPATARARQGPQARLAAELGRPGSHRSHGVKLLWILCGYGNRAR